MKMLRKIKKYIIFILKKPSCKPNLIKSYKTCNNKN